MESQTTGDAKRRRLKARLSRRYSCSPHETLTIRRIEAHVLAAERPVCLLCFERDPARCHRRVLAERLAPRGFETVDLYGDFL